ncbi:MAG: 4Fe-4S binding protein [Dethiobacteria bacterium]|nr:4Fe-4S binding protein [Bacillota bacterium]
MIQINEKKALIDPRRCIRCYCCHEVCPHSAIKLLPG